LPKSLSHSSSNPSPRLGGAWSRLDTGDGSSGIDGSGFSTSVDPPAGPEGGELDDGRAAGDSSGFAKIWPSGWPKSLSHSSSNPPPGIGGAWSVALSSRTCGLERLSARLSSGLAGLVAGLGRSRATASHRDIQPYTLSWRSFRKAIHHYAC
jgi:hypothetical protein